MSDVQYYKGVHKVRILTKSEGYWIVEALEDFEDTLNGKRVHVKIGERRIVSVDNICRQKTLLPAIEEHAYELHMEEELKRFVDNEEAKEVQRPKKNGNKRISQ